MMDGFHWMQIETAMKLYYKCDSLRDYACLQSLFHGCIFFKPLIYYMETPSRMIKTTSLKL